MDIITHTTCGRIEPRQLVQSAHPARHCDTSFLTPLWDLPWEQEIKSAVTSINGTKTPALFKKVEWVRETRNADLGAGKFDNISEYLLQFDIQNFSFDPFNLSLERNLEAIRNIYSGQCDSCTVTNTLNVIQSRADRATLIARAHDTLKPGGVAYFQFHEGDRTGQGRVSQRDKAGNPLAWQENRRTRDYLPEIEPLFCDIKVSGNVITARN